LIDVARDNLMALRGGLDDADVTGEQQEEVPRLLALREDLRVLGVACGARRGEHLVQFLARQAGEGWQVGDQGPVEGRHQVGLPLSRYASGFFLAAVCVSANKDILTRGISLSTAG